MTKAELISEIEGVFGLGAVINSSVNYSVKEDGGILFATKIRIGQASGQFLYQKNGEKAIYDLMCLDSEGFGPTLQEALDSLEEVLVDGRDSAAAYVQDVDAALVIIRGS